MERIAILSDIHANLPALEAVLRDVESRRVHKIYCLGDLIGYGPNPKAVIDMARSRFAFVLMGNHDEAISSRVSRRFKWVAAKAANWTQKRLKPRRGRSGPQVRGRWSFIRKLPHTQDLGPWLMAHGTLHSNLDYVYEPDEALEVFAGMEQSRVCFLGHTHEPAIFVLDPAGGIEHIQPVFGKRYRIRGPRTIINVGSVGQPRDGDPRACWVLAREDGSFAFRRVAYDIDRVAEEIFRSRGLPNSLGRRLYKGE